MEIPSSKPQRKFSKSKIKEDLPELKPKKIFLTGFNPNQYTKKDLYGLLKNEIPGFADIILPKKTYKGFAFVNVRTKEDADKALQMGSINIGGYKMFLKEFKKGKKLAKAKNLMNERKIFISQIPMEWTNEKLRAIFQEFGELEEIYICLNNPQTGEKGDKKSELRDMGTGIGFAIYKDPSVARLIYSQRTVLYENTILKVEKADQNKSSGLSKMSFEEREIKSHQIVRKSVRKKVRFYSEEVHKKFKSCSFNSKRDDLSQFQAMESVSEEQVYSEGINDYMKNMNSSQILEIGFKEIFQKLGIANFEFEEFIKFTAYQYLRSKQISLDVNMAGGLRGEGQPVYGNGNPRMDNQFNTAQQGHLDRSNYQGRRMRKRYDCFRPLEMAYHELFGELNFKLDHSFRNLRMNGVDIYDEKNWTLEEWHYYE